MTETQLEAQLIAARQRIAELEASVDAARTDSTVFLRRTIDALKDTVLVFELDSGTAVLWNSSFARISGYSDAEIAARKAPSDWFSEIDIERSQEPGEKALRGEIDTIEMSLITKDGTLVPTEYTGSILQNFDGHPPCLIIIGRDVTERKRTELEKTRLETQLRQAQKMEAIGRLAGGIAHDFNNILTAIVGNVDIALFDLNLNEPLYETLHEIRIASDRATDLTRQLLAFSRMQLIKPRVIDLNTLILDIRKMLVRIIGEDICLETSSMKALGRIKADPGQIEQVIVNLAVNARDAMPGGGQLTIETNDIALDERYCGVHPSLKPGDFVLLKIADTGEGMTQEIKARAFDPFFTRKESDKGTGLGLATVYGIVKQHGGHIELQSEVGEGTTFCAYFPLVTEQAEPIIRKPAADEQSLGTETILVVEDDPIVLSIAARNLRRLGYTVLQAEKGSEALKIAIQHDGTIDLLITDVIMPGMNGREVAEAVRKQRPEIKVIFTSGYSEDVISHHGVLDDGIEFIGKPYAPRGLALKVRQVLAKSP